MLLLYIRHDANTQMLSCCVLRWYCQHRMELQYAVEYGVVSGDGLGVVLGVVDIQLYSYVQHRLQIRGKAAPSMELSQRRFYRNLCRNAGN